MTLSDPPPARRLRPPVFTRHSLPALLMSTGLALLAGGLRLWIRELHPRGLTGARRRATA